jgi:hypothetical protein
LTSGARFDYLPQRAAHLKILCVAHAPILHKQAKEPGAIAL